MLYSVVLGGVFSRTIGFHNIPSIPFDSAKFAAMSWFCIGTASAFGLVTPPYGLCLLIACKIGDIQVKNALRDVVIVLMPMFLVLLIVIFFPELILALPKLLMANFI